MLIAYLFEYHSIHLHVCLHIIRITLFNFYVQMMWGANMEEGNFFTAYKRREISIENKYGK